MTIGSATLDIEDDDIFARPPRAAQHQEAKRSSITCRVCGLGVTVPLDHVALLCLPCLSDMDATRARVLAWQEAALARLTQVQHVWDTERTASPAQGHWEAVQAALIGVAEHRIAQHVFDATWAKRKAEGGALAQLLVAYEAYARECDQIAEELARLHTAQTEINAAWLATNDV